MASKSFIILLLVTVQYAGIVQPSMKCGLFQYHDPHMDDCAPCSQLCLHMNVMGTEEQCKSVCTDYLTAGSCTYKQYYDDVVGSCVYCSELCDFREVTGTAGDCSSKCHNYLKAQNCTEEQYFDVTDMSCSACSQLCSQRDEQGDTIPKCFHECPKYVEKYPPGNIIGEPSQDDSAKTQAVSGEDKTPSKSVHPGIIVAVVIAVLLVIAAVVVVVILKGRGPPHPYDPAPSAEVDSEADKEERRAMQPNMVQGEPGLLGDPQQERRGSSLRFGQQECNPNVPSAHCI